MMRSQKNENNDSWYGKTNRNCSINLLFGLNDAINNVINCIDTDTTVSICIKIYVPIEF